MERMSIAGWSSETPASAPSSSSRSAGEAGLRPAEVCRALLAALEAAEGRRRKRKRDQTPDAFGLGVKRDLLRSAVEEDPAPEDFEAWLLHYPHTRTAREMAGPALAMARAVFEEWRLAHSMGEFRRWLEAGAPSDDIK
jgi:hypothetical protein